MFVPCAPASVSKNSVFSYEKIYQAYLKCRKNKRNSINALKFEFNAEGNIINLEDQLNKKTYRPSRSILFTTTKPKLREVFAADFKDRIVHHLLVESLEREWEPTFIHDSYACRTGKGTHKAVLRLKNFMQKITANGKKRAYYLQLDIKDFFMTINKDILFDLLKKRMSDPSMLWLAEIMVFWDCTKSYQVKGNPKMVARIPENKSLFGKENKRGLPIGNLTSQFFANVYLNELDQYVKHQLKARYYIRYVDDFVILDNDREKLMTYLYKIENFLLEKLKLRLHPKRRKLQTISSGVDFLGYIVRHNYVLVRRRVLNNLRQKLKSYRRARIINRKQLRATINSYLGHFKIANTFLLERKILNKKWIKFALKSS